MRFLSASNSKPATEISRLSTTHTPIGTGQRKNPRGPRLVRASACPRITQTRCFGSCSRKYDQHRPPAVAILRVRPAAACMYPGPQDRGWTSEGYLIAGQNSGVLRKEDIAKVSLARLEGMSSSAVPYRFTYSSTYMSPFGTEQTIHRTTEHP